MNAATIDEVKWPLQAVTFSGDCSICHVTGGVAAFFFCSMTTCKSIFYALYCPKTSVSLPALTCVKCNCKIAERTVLLDKIVNVTTK